MRPGLSDPSVALLERIWMNSDRLEPAPTSARSRAKLCASVFRSAGLKLARRANAQRSVARSSSSRPQRPARRRCAPICISGAEQLWAWTPNAGTATSRAFR
jgi:hypothetical protein